MPVDGHEGSSEEGTLEQRLQGNPGLCPAGSTRRALQAEGEASAEAGGGSSLGHRRDSEGWSRVLQGERRPGRAARSCQALDFTPGTMQTLWRTLSRGLMCSRKGFK